MASFEQDLIIFEDDTLMLQYTFTDLEGTFNSSNAAWWGAVPKSTWNPETGDPPASVSATVQKGSGNWTFSGGLPTGFPTSGITVVTGDTIVRVFFTQADFVETTAGTLDTNTEYCTELVLSTDLTENTSVVAATGKLFISASIFSAEGYRPL